MVSNSREWSVPAPVRALLWWPGVSFVLVIVAPATIESTIVASGALLAVMGGFAAAAAERLREHRAETAVASEPAPAYRRATTTSASAAPSREIAPPHTRPGALTAYAPAPVRSPSPDTSPASLRNYLYVRY